MAPATPARSLTGRQARTMLRRRGLMLQRGVTQAGTGIATPPAGSYPIRLGRMTHGFPVMTRLRLSSAFQPIRPLPSMDRGSRDTHSGEVHHTRAAGSGRKAHGER